MRKVLFFRLFSLAICSMILSLSCSGDKGSGPVDEETFLAMKDMAQSDLENIVAITLQGFDNFDGLDTLFFDDVGASMKPVGGIEDLDTSYVNYSYANGWHVINVGADSAQYTETGYSTMSVEVVDSVQFRTDGDPVFEPDDNTDFLDFRVWASANLYGTDESFALSFDIDDYYVSNQYQILSNGNVQVDGVIQYDYGMTISIEDEEATVNLEYDMTISDFVINPTSGCPISGTLSASAYVSAQGDGQFESGSMSMTLEITGASQMQIHFEMDGQTWDGIEYFDCNDFNVSPFRVPPITGR